MQLNIEKTKYLLFRSKGPTNVPALPLEFQGVPIQHTSTIRFLGVVFQENLSWSPQVDALRTDVSRAIGMLNKLRSLLPPEAKRKIYYALVHSRLIFCSLVWSTTTETNLNYLLSLQKRAI